MYILVFKNMGTKPRNRAYRNKPICTQNQLPNKDFINSLMFTPKSEDNKSQEDIVGKLLSLSSPSTNASQREKCVQLAISPARIWHSQSLYFSQCMSLHSVCLLNVCSGFISTQDSTLFLLFGSPIFHCWKFSFKKKETTKNTVTQSHCLFNCIS